MSSLPAPDTFHPRQDNISKRHIRSSLESLQSAFVNQVTAEPAEAKSVLVVAEARPGDDGEPHIGETRSVAVAMLETEVYHATNNEPRQVLVAKQCWRDNLGQNLESIEDIGVVHQWQFNEFFNQPGFQTETDLIVFALYSIAGGMGRPILSLARQCPSYRDEPCCITRRSFRA
jgi:hypothetical protein